MGPDMGSPTLTPSLPPTSLGSLLVASVWPMAPTGTLPAFFPGLPRALMATACRTGCLVVLLASTVVLTDGVLHPHNSVAVITVVVDVWCVGVLGARSALLRETEPGTFPHR